MTFPFLVTSTSGLNFELVFLFFDSIMSSISYAGKPQLGMFESCCVELHQMIIQVLFSNSNIMDFCDCRCYFSGRILCCADIRKMFSFHVINFIILLLIIIVCSVYFYFRNYRINLASVFSQKICHSKWLDSLLCFNLPLLHSIGN